MPQFLEGLLIVAGGLLILKYRKRVKEWMGDIATAEKYLGSGGTYTLITIIGVLMVVAAIMHMFDGLSPLLGGIFQKVMPFPGNS